MDANSLLSTVVVAINTRCNLQCPQCAYPLLKPATHTEMRPDLFARVVTESRRMKVDTIRILGLAEPALHSRFSEILGIAAQAHPMSVHILSNGTAIESGERRKVLLAAPPDLLEISIDAYSPELYRRVRGGSEQRFRRIVEGTRLYAAELRERRLETACDARNPKVRVSFVMHPESVAEAEAFHEGWVHHVDEVRFRSPHNFSGIAHGLPSQNILVQIAPPGCGFIQSRLFVDVEGQIHSCTLDFQNDFVIGRLDVEHALPHAWESQKQRALQEAHRRGSDLPRACVGCSKCSDLP